MSFSPFEELGGSPAFDFALEHSRGVRDAKIPWDKIADLAQFLFVTGTGLSAPMPGFPFLRARSMHVEPFIGEKQKIVSPDTSNDLYGSLNTYEFAKVRIEYETPQHTPDQGDDPVLLLSHRWSIGGEFLTIESAGLEWSDGIGEVSDDVTAGILIPTIEHQITWPRVIAPPFEAIRDRLGTVNAETMTFQTGVIAPETLLFLGAELQRDILSTGALAWQVVYRFSEKRVPSVDVVEDASNLAECNLAGGAWFPTSEVNPETNGICFGVGVGGWNHFFRSEDQEKDPTLAGVPAGFYRLQTNNGFPIYQIKTHGPLFVEAL